MLSLRAVVPDRLGVHDADGVCQTVLGLSERNVGRHEAREESVCNVGHDILHGHARLVKGRLGYGVGLPTELVQCAIHAHGMLHTLG